MKKRCLCLAGVALLVTSCGHVRVPSPDSEGRYTNVDQRRTRTAAPAATSRARTRAIAEAQARIGGLHVDVDELMGAPGFVRSASGLLAVPKPDSEHLDLMPRVVPPHPQPRAVPADYQRTLRQFLDRNKDLFGYDASVLALTKLQRNSVTARGQMRTVVWQQEIEGVPVFEALLAANFVRGDSLASLSTRLVPDLRGAAGVRAPAISAAAALAAAARAIGETNAVAADFSSGENPRGNERQQNFSGGPVIGTAEASLVWLPTGRPALRLCWRVVLTGRRSGKLFQVLIDAASGELWLRQCWSGDFVGVPGQAAYLVFDRDSAAPLLPGWSTPLTNQAPETSQASLTLVSFSTNGSPIGWLNRDPAIFGLTNTTFGNNIDAHLDWSLQYPAYGAAVNPPRPAGAVTNLEVEFTGPSFTANLAQFPTNLVNRNAAVVNSFYWCNRMHDTLYDLGFTEAAGNFQYDNFSRGGVDRDPVQMNAQSGAAFGLRGGGIFSASPVDGGPGQIMITIFGGVQARDGVLDETLVLHEYTHLLSTRLVGHGAGISAHQTLGLAEGWSDFYALALLTGAADEPHGVYPVTGYASYQLRTASFLQNYYFGSRVYPYSTDLTKNPMTFGFLQADPAVNPYPGVPINPLYNPTNAWPTPFPLNEAHAFGQVWGEALWDARANLIELHGFTNGNTLTLQLVTDAMKLGPANPAYLEARDAVLLADQVRTGGENQLELWTAFARRGMGYTATNAPSDYVNIDNLIPVRESFSIPPLTTNISSALCSSPAVGLDGTIYVGSTNGTLYAVGSDGTIKWSFSALGIKPAFNSSPAIGSGGAIYIGSDDANLYAVDPGGALLWRTNLGGQVFASPALASDGTIYVGTSNGKFYSINPDGTLKWSRTAGTGVRSSAAVALDGTIYFGTMSSNLCALNPANGSALPGWPVAVAGAVYSSPALDAEGNIYAGALNGKVYAFAPDGTVKSGWPFTTGGAVRSSPAIGSNGVVYIGSSDGKLYAINPDGTTNWTYTTGGAVNSSPALGRDGSVFVGSQDGNLHVVNADGTGRWVYPLGGPVFSSPVIDPVGALYVGSTGGNLYVLPTRTQFADGPWPMFRQNSRHTADVKNLFLRPGKVINGDTFRFEITGPAGATCEVEATTSLSSEWIPLGTVTLTNGVGIVETPLSDSEQRFYRARF